MRIRDIQVSGMLLKEEKLLIDQKREELTQKLNSFESEIPKLEKQLKTVNEDKLRFKRKEDLPALEKAVLMENDIKEKIDYDQNEIQIINRKLADLEIEEQKSMKVKSDMDRVLEQIKSGCTTPQASKNTNVSLSRIHKWMDEGKNNESINSRYFYTQMRDIQNFNYSFYGVLQKEFAKQNMISLLPDFVPRSYPLRLDRFYNENSLIWFSRLELKDKSSLYYFGLKGTRIPRMILVFNNDVRKSNFRLYGDEVVILLKIKDVKTIKRAFKIYYASKDRKSDLYYVSLGGLNSGQMSQNLELLMEEHYKRFENPIDVFKIVHR